MATNAAAARAGSYYRLLTLRAKLKYFAAIFFIFAPASLLVISPFEQHRSWVSMLTWVAMGGFCAAGWAYVGTVGRKILWVLLPAQVLWFVVPRMVFPADFRSGFTFSLEGTFCIVLIVVGYVFFIRFINTEAAKNIRMQAELTLAQQIHASLIPPVEHRTPRLELYGRSVASAEMGGDLLDVVERDGTTDVIVADVSGHGVRAGVVMGMMKSALRTRLRAGGSVDEVLRDVNEVLCELTSPEMFVTAACLHVDDAGALLFAGAGHGAVLHHRREANAVSKLESDGLPLGIMADEQYSARVIEVAPGDTLLLTTDGLAETFSEQGEPFGEDRIERLFFEHAAKPLRDIHDAIMDEVRRHGPQSDDQTLLLVRLC